MLEGIQGVTSTLVQVALDGLAQQQRVIANNIANANSEGFSAQRFDFEKALRAAANSGLNESSADAKSRLMAVGNAIESGDYIHNATDTTVQLDLEMARMNETVLRYQALIQGLNQSGSLVQMAITGDGNK